MATRFENSDQKILIGFNFYACQIAILTMLFLPATSFAVRRNSPYFCYNGKIANFLVPQGCILHAVLYGYRISERASSCLDLDHPHCRLHTGLIRNLQSRHQATG
jgi:hypothetical protein